MSVHPSTVSMASTTNASDATISNYGRHLQTVLIAYQLLRLSTRKFSVYTEVSPRNTTLWIRCEESRDLLMCLIQVLSATCSGQIQTKTSKAGAKMTEGCPLLLVAT